MDVQTVTQNTPTPSISDLEYLLLSLNAQEAAEIAAGKVIEPEVDETEELEDELLADLARAEVYQAQKAETDVTPVATVEPTKTKAPRQPKTANPNATPRTPRKNLADLDDAVFQLFDSETPGPANKTVTLDARPKQVKIAEKFDNLFLSLDAGKGLSRYTQIAIQRLNASGTMTSADLVAAYKAEGLKDGTARSQAGQLMELFNVVGIANRAGQALTMRSDSVVARKLLAMLAAPAA